MTRISSYIFLTVVLISSASSEESPLPEKAQKLRESYRAAVERATSPLTRKYLEELERLKIEYTKAADLKGALAIEGEMKLLSTSATIDSVISTDKESLTKRDLETLLLAKTWRWGAVSMSKDGNRVDFEDNGKAKYHDKEKLTDWTWNIIDSKEGLIDLFGNKLRLQPDGQFKSTDPAKERWLVPMEE